MLEITDLTVAIGEKEILHKINLTVRDWEVHALFGPNGSGKTTLIRTIMGFPECEVKSGSIVFNGEDITSTPINVRAGMGLGFSFQRPPTITGVKTRKVVEMIGKGKADVESLAKAVNMKNFLDRDINAGFSGGEIKRAELLQLLAQEPEFILLDEPESGVDMEAMNLIGETINQLLKKNLKLRERKALPHPSSAIIITHTGKVLDYILADKGHVLCNGRIVCNGNPNEILGTIQKKGYEACMTCPI
jgi:Fe-S cluster assembly ATP-binding protein